MSFLTLSNGSTTLTVRVKSNAAEEKYNEHGLDRERMFDGTMRQIRRGIYRQWDCTSKYLTQSDSDALCALLKSNTLPLSATGDLVQSTDGIAVMPILVSNSPVHTGDGWRRSVVFTLHETPALLPADTSAVAWLALLRGRGYWQDVDKSVAAGNGDPIKVWEDQSGNGRDGISDGSGFTGDDVRPTRDGDEVSFGHSDSAPGTGVGRSLFTIANDGLSGSAEIMIGLRGEFDPPSDAARTLLFNLNSSSFGATLFPNTSGHIVEGFGLSGPGPQDIGAVGADLTDFHVYNVSCDNGTKVMTVRLDNVVVFTYTLPSGSFGWPGNPMFLGMGQGIDLGWQGHVRDLLIANDAMTDAQRRSWYDYMRGATDEPPLPA
jgi:hypothetical protein